MRRANVQAQSDRRAEILVAMTEIELAKNATGGETPLQ